MNVSFIKTPIGNIGYKANSKPVNKTGISSSLSFGKIGLTKKKDTFNIYSFDDAVEESAKILKPFKTFSIKDYKKLKKDEIKTLRQVTFPLEQDFNEILSAYTIMKENLNKNYPNGYVFVSIGRSPAFFAKMLKTEGQEVKFCPCVSLSRDFEDIPYDFKRSYPDYLKSIGITKDAIENSNKPFVFVDYTFSRKSLRNFEKLLRRSLGISRYESENLHFDSLNTDLLEEYKISNRDMQKFVREYLCINRGKKIKIYSPVPSLNDYTTDVTEDIQNHEENLMAKLMSFYMFDYIEKKKSTFKKLSEVLNSKFDNCRKGMMSLSQSE